MSLKEQVHTQCRVLITAKLESLHQALKELIDSAGNETKSSAGDKFETGRAMLHIEQDHIRKQVAEVLAQKAVLEAIDPGRQPERIALGSLVKASGGYYFLSTALCKMIVEGQLVIALSLQSPLGGRLAGLELGDRVMMNGKELVVEQIL